MNPYMQTSIIIGSIILGAYIAVDIPPGVLLILIATLPTSIYMLHKIDPTLHHRYSLPWRIAAYLLAFIFTANLITGPAIIILSQIIAGILHLFCIPYSDTMEYLYGNI